MITKEYIINGMSCNHCVIALNKELSTLKLTIDNVEVGKTKLTYNENEISFLDIKNAVEEAGFEIVE